MPMNGDYLLDTNIVIGAFDRDRAILKRLKRAENVFLPSIVVGELLYGPLKSRPARTNVDRIEELSLAKAVIPCDYKNARHYNQINKRDTLHSRPIPYIAMSI